MIQTDGGIIVTPPAIAKDAGKVAPHSAETAAETPTGASPEALQVYVLDEQQDEDSVETVVTPRRGLGISSSRAMLLSQMEIAIPSPESLAQTIDLDVSTCGSPPLGYDKDLFLPSSGKSDSASNVTPFKPSKLTFSDRQEIEEMPKPAESSHQLLVPYAMAPVESLASLPFDCRDDMKRSNFRPRADSEDSLELREKRPETSTQSLVRTLFGWVETTSKRRPETIKAKVLSDRDVGLPRRCDLEAIHPYSSPVRTREPDNETVIHEPRFRPSIDGPGYSALVASKWFGSHTLTDTEEEPPRIERVREVFMESYVEPDDEHIEEVREDPKKFPRKRNWDSICFYVGVIGVLLVIIVTASMLLANKVKGSPVANEAPRLDDSEGPTADVPEKEGDKLYPGGFFSTSNQFCTAAVKIDRLGAVYSGSTTGFTVDDTIDSCGDFLSLGRAAWFVYTAKRSQLIEASTCEGTDFDTQITVSSGANCEKLACVTFNDQGCGDQSRAIWYAEAGETYFINVHGYRDARGDFSLTLNRAKNHDECSSAMGPVSVGATMFGTTAGSTVEMDVPQCGDVNLMQNPGVWYILEDAEGWLRAEVVTRHAGFLPQISVYSGTSCDTLSCEGGSSTGSLAWRVVSGTTYYVLVNGLNTAHGDFDLSFSWESKDTCEFATPISVNGAAVTQTTAEARLHDVPVCGTTGFHTAPGMWFSVNGTGNLLSATTCGADSDLDSHVSIFRDSCSSLQCVGSTGQDLPCGASGAVSWFSEANVAYKIYVSGRGSRVGSFALKVADSSAEAGETCQTPVALGSGAVTVSGSNVDAPEVSTVCGDIASTRGVWYELVGSGNMLTLWTCDPETTFDARVSIFTGNCDSLTCEAFTTSSCSELTQAPFQFNTVAGVKYSLLVHGSSSSEMGSFSLTLSSDSSNTACASALAITPAANTYFGTTEGVSGGRAIGCADGQDAVEGPSGVWYSFVGTGAQFSFSTCSESTVFATNIAVFTGACFNLECVSGESSPCGQQGVVSFPTTEGEDYFIRITGANATEFGNFVLGVSVRSVSFGW